MDRPYLLPRERQTPPVVTLREPARAHALKVTDPARRAMTDFRLQPLPTVSEELALEQVLDQMFRLGAHAFLVVRNGVVTGLIGAEQVRERGARHRSLRAADVMTPSPEVPAVDWLVIEESQVRDLMEIFDGSGARHLMVLENESPTRAHVRGLIHRERLRRQLGSRWPGRTMMLSGVAR